MRAITLAFVSLCLHSAPAHAKPGDMKLTQFMPTVQKLKKNGILAPLSGEMKVVRREVRGAADDYRARIKRDKAAGRNPHSCPPKKGSMNSKELLAHFESYPKSRYASVSVRTAFNDLMKKKYPC
ncbi:MAG: hypothetical protein ABJP34_04665 [Erythrobacter sp.]